MPTKLTSQQHLHCAAAYLSRVLAMSLTTRHCPTCHRLQAAVSPASLLPVLLVAILAFLVGHFLMPDLISSLMGSSS